MAKTISQYVKKELTREFPGLKFSCRATRTYSFFKSLEITVVGIVGSPYRMSEVRLAASKYEKMDIDKKTGELQGSKYISIAPVANQDILDYRFEFRSAVGEERLDSTDPKIYKPAKEEFYALTGNEITLEQYLEQKQQAAEANEEVEETESNEQTVEQPTIKKLPANTQELNFPITHVSYTYTENGITSVGFKSVEVEEEVEQEQAVSDVIGNTWDANLIEEVSNIAINLNWNMSKAIALCLNLVPISLANKFGQLATDMGYEYGVTSHDLDEWRIVRNKARSFDVHAFIVALLYGFHAHDLASAYRKLPIK